MRYAVAFIVGLIIGFLCYLIPVSIHELLHPLVILYPLTVLAAFNDSENLAIIIALFQAPFYTFFYTLGKTKRARALIVLTIAAVHIIAAAFIIHSHLIIYGEFFRK